MAEILVEIIFEMVLRPLFCLLFVGIGYVVGFLPVMVGSLGMVEPSPIEHVFDKAFYNSAGLKWWHLTYEKDRNRYLPAESVAIVGWVLLGSIGVAVWLAVKLIG
jgi:hypothetical protein